MKLAFFLFLPLLTASALPAAGQPVHVRYPQGTAHGFLALRTLEGKTLALGDLTQTVHGKRITSRLLFHFKDGSLDDDRTVFTQGGAFKLVTDHHVQRRPSFPKPLDMSIDVPNQTVISREPGNGGAVKVTKQHMDLPPDLANGIILVLLTNIPPSAAKTDLPMLVAYHGVRLVHLSVTPSGTKSFRVGGSPRAARELTIKIELGGLTGMIAPILGK